ncbi:Pyridine nucleotide-disulphide oxidoreductase, dimerisation domain, partial [Streptomyces atratus]
MNTLPPSTTTVSGTITGFAADCSIRASMSSSCRCGIWEAAIRNDADQPGSLRQRLKQTERLQRGQQLRTGNSEVRGTFTLADGWDDLRVDHGGGGCPWAVRRRRTRGTGTRSTATFSQPQVASFGLTEQQARDEGHDVLVAKFPFTANGKAHGLGGFVKLIADAKHGERHCHVGGRRGRGLDVDHAGGGSSVVSALPSYKGHGYPVEVISHCVWLY